ncbi:MAG: SAF domain-containing protein, partial [Campylobacter sp.]|nr:SAF domain-containing protein [Campylobacter sp.]
RSLYVCADVKKGEIFSEENLRSVRPNLGLMPRFLPDVLGKKARRDIEAATPLSWDLIC